MFSVKRFTRILTKFTGKHLCQSLFLMMLQATKNSQENTCARVSFLACNFIKKETLAQMFSCESCQISKNTFFTEHICTSAFELIHKQNCPAMVEVNLWNVTGSTLSRPVTSFCSYTIKICIYCINLVCFLWMR